MKNFYASVLITILAAAYALNGQTTGSVAGTVLENGSVALVGATISYKALGHLEKDSQGLTQYVRSKIGGSVKSNADGTFAITGLAAGTYVICASGTLPIHISSCESNASNPQVSIVAGESVTALRLNVARGALLAITVNDFAGCIAKNGKAPVYIFANGRPQQAMLVSATPGAYHYRALVPQQIVLSVKPTHPCTFTEFSGNSSASVGLTLPAIQGESANATLTAQ
jgi:hypothetical protein